MKRRTLPRFTLHIDEAAVVLHDAISNCEAEARSLSRRLGGEKRLEHPAADEVGHPCSIIDDGNAHIRRGDGLFEPFPKCFAILQRCDNGQGPRPRLGARFEDCVAAVDAEVEEDLP